MAAISDAGGARSAPRVVWRALLRVVLLSGLVAAGWLLGSGISHADEDLGLPGTGLIHVVNAVSSDDGSGDERGTPAAVVPTVVRALSTAPVPRLPVQPPGQVSILQPIVQAAGVAKPLDQVLPVFQPLTLPAPHPVLAQHMVPGQKFDPEQKLDPGQKLDTVSPPAQAGEPVTVLTAAPTAAPAPTLTPVVHASPTIISSPAHPATEPVTIQPAVGDGPASPMPATPPGTTTSLCAIGAGAGGAGGKNGPDAAVHDGWVPEGLAQPDGPLDRDTSGLPRSLSVQPSTSPD